MTPNWGTESEPDDDTYQMLEDSEPGQILEFIKRHQDLVAKLENMIAALIIGAELSSEQIVLKLMGVKDCAVEKIQQALDVLQSRTKRVDREPEDGSEKFGDSMLKQLIGAGLATGAVKKKR
jgi:hypothetical protein